MVNELFLATSSKEIIPGRPGIVGCPLDITSTYRSGSDKAPAEIRLASESIETYSPFLDMDLLDQPFFDLGNLNLFDEPVEESLGKIYRMVREVLENRAFPLCLGGEHTITLPVVRALNEFDPHFIVLHLDAHADLRTLYEGNPLNHATVMRRVYEMLGPGRLIQLGIHSGTREEFSFMRAHGTRLQWGPYAGKLLLERVRDAPVYLTFDLDVLDPACLPGTGNPEAGGWFYDDLERFFVILDRLRVLGADVVELNPDLDPSKVSSIMSAKIVRELLLIIGRNQ